MGKNRKTGQRGPDTQKKKKILRGEDGTIVHCPHGWAPAVPPVEGRPQFDEECRGCGAGCSRDLAGRIVAYDREWDWGRGGQREEVQYGLPDAADAPSWAYGGAEA